MAATVDGRNSKSDLASFVAFYQEADRRSEAMVDNLLKAFAPSLHSSKNQPSFAVLVSGGFHSDDIEKHLAARGATVVTFAPKLSRADDGGSSYLAVFTREKTSLEKLFEGQKLFVSPEQMNDGLVLDLAVMAGGVAGEIRGPEVIREIIGDARSSARVETMPGGFFRVIIGRLGKTVESTFRFAGDRISDLKRGEAARNDSPLEFVVGLLVGRSLAGLYEKYPRFTKLWTAPIVEHVLILFLVPGILAAADTGAVGFFFASLWILGWSAYLAYRQHRFVFLDYPRGFLGLRGGVLSADGSMVYLGDVQGRAHSNAGARRSNYKPWFLFDFILAGNYWDEFWNSFEQSVRPDGILSRWLDIPVEQRKRLVDAWNDGDYAGPPQISFIQLSQVESWWREGYAVFNHGAASFGDPAETGVAVAAHGFALSALARNSAVTKFPERFEGFMTANEGGTVRVSAGAFSRVILRRGGEEYVALLLDEDKLREKGTVEYKPFGGHMLMKRAFFETYETEWGLKLPDGKEEEILSELRRKGAADIAFFMPADKLPLFQELLDAELATIRRGGESAFFEDPMTTVLRELREELTGQDETGMPVEDGLPPSLQLSPEVFAPVVRRQTTSAERLLLFAGFALTTFIALAAMQVLRELPLAPAVLVLAGALVALAPHHFKNRLAEIFPAMGSGNILWIGGEKGEQPENAVPASAPVEPTDWSDAEGVRQRIVQDEPHAGGLIVTSDVRAVPGDWTTGTGDAVFIYKELYKEHIGPRGKSRYARWQTRIQVWAMDKTTRALWRVGEPVTKAYTDRTILKRVADAGILSAESSTRATNPVVADFLGPILGEKYVRSAYWLEPLFFGVSAWGIRALWVGGAANPVLTAAAVLWTILWTAVFVSFIRSHRRESWVMKSLGLRPSFGKALAVGLVYVFFLGLSFWLLSPAHFVQPGMDITVFVLSLMTMIGLQNWIENFDGTRSAKPSALPEPPQEPRVPPFVAENETNDLKFLLLAASGRMAHPDAFPDQEDILLPICNALLDSEPLWEEFPGTMADLAWPLLGPSAALPAELRWSAFEVLLRMSEDRHLSLAAWQVVKKHFRREEGGVWISVPQPMEMSRRPRGDDFVSLPRSAWERLDALETDLDDKGAAPVRDRIAFYVKVLKQAENASVRGAAVRRLDDLLKGINGIPLAAARENMSGGMLADLIWAMSIDPIFAKKESYAAPSKEQLEDMNAMIGLVLSLSDMVMIPDNKETERILDDLQRMRSAVLQWSREFLKFRKRERNEPLVILSLVLMDLIREFKKFDVEDTRRPPVATAEEGVASLSGAEKEIAMGIIPSRMERNFTLDYIQALYKVHVGLLRGADPVKALAPLRSWLAEAEDAGGVRTELLESADAETLRTNLDREIVLVLRSETLAGSAEETLWQAAVALQEAGLTDRQMNFLFDSFEKANDNPSPGPSVGGHYKNGLWVSGERTPKRKWAKFDKKAIESWLAQSLDAGVPEETRLQVLSVIRTIYFDGRGRLREENVEVAPPRIYRGFFLRALVLNPADYVYEEESAGGSSLPGVGASPFLAARAGAMEVLRKPGSWRVSKAERQQVRLAGAKRHLAYAWLVETVILSLATGVLLLAFGQDGVLSDLEILFSAFAPAYGLFLDHRWGKLPDELGARASQLSALVIAVLWIVTVAFEFAFFRGALEATLANHLGVVLFPLLNFVIHYKMDRPFSRAWPAVKNVALKGVQLLGVAVFIPVLFMFIYNFGPLMPSIMGGLIFLTGMLVSLDWIARTFRSTLRGDGTAPGADDGHTVAAIPPFILFSGWMAMIFTLIFKQVRLNAQERAATRRAGQEWYLRNATKIETFLLSISTIGLGMLLALDGFAQTDLAITAAVPSVVFALLHIPWSGWLHRKFNLHAVSLDAVFIGVVWTLSVLVGYDIMFVSGVQTLEQLILIGMLIVLNYFLHADLNEPDSDVLDGALWMYWRGAVLAVNWLTVGLWAAVFLGIVELPFFLIVLTIVRVGLWLYRSPRAARHPLNAGVDADGDAPGEEETGNPPAASAGMFLLLPVGGVHPLLSALVIGGIIAYGAYKLSGIFRARRLGRALARTLIAADVLRREPGDAQAREEMARNAAGLLGPAPKIGYGNFDGTTSNPGMAWAATINRASAGLEAAQRSAARNAFRAEWRSRYGKDPDAVAVGENAYDAVFRLGGARGDLNTLVRDESRFADGDRAFGRFFLIPAGADVSSADFKTVLQAVRDAWELNPAGSVITFVLEDSTLEQDLKNEARAAGLDPERIYFLPLAADVFSRRDGLLLLDAPGVQSAMMAEPALSNLSGIQWLPLARMALIHTEDLPADSPLRNCVVILLKELLSMPIGAEDWKGFLQAIRTVAAMA